MKNGSDEGLTPTAAIPGNGQGPPSKSSSSSSGGSRALAGSLPSFDTASGMNNTEGIEINSGS